MIDRIFGSGNASFSTLGRPRGGLSSDEPRGRMRVVRIPDRSSAFDHVSRIRRQRMTSRVVPECSSGGSGRAELPPHSVNGGLEEAARGQDREFERIRKPRAKRSALP
jgi:hypothetical protein